MVGAERKWAIESALRNNETVPADELAKYPELAEIYPSAKIAPIAAEAAPAAAPTLSQEVLDAWHINARNQQEAKRIRELYKNVSMEERAAQKLGSQLQDAEKIARGSGYKLSATLKKNNLTRDDVRRILGEVTAPI